MSEYLSKRRRKLDLAYACHAFFGTLGAVIGVAYLTESPEGQAIATLAGMVLGIPVLGAFFVLVVLTVLLWRHVPLILLLVLLVAGFAPLGNESFHELTGLPPEMLAIGYLAAAIAYAARWFFRIRPRLPVRPEDPT